MADIPYIGPFFSARLRRLGFATVNDLVLYFNRRPTLFIYNGLSTLLQNPRRNQCLDDDYHVADFNVCAFAVLSTRSPLALVVPRNVFFAQVER